MIPLTDYASMRAAASVAYDDEAISSLARR
jgi:hypothetical protein